MAKDRGFRRILANTRVADKHPITGRIPKDGGPVWVVQRHLRPRRSNPVDTPSRAVRGLNFNHLGLLSPTVSKDWDCGFDLSFGFDLA